MKELSVKLLSLLLAGLMLLSCLVACGEPTESDPSDSQGESTQAAESNTETQDIAQVALDALGEIDFGKKTFGVLYSENFKSEVYAENSIVDSSGGDDQVINDAVYQRNTLLEELCNLTFEPIPSVDLKSDAHKAATGGINDIYLIDSNAREAADFASSGYLYNYLDLGVDVDQPWWDQGTADFALNGKIFFMNGAVNFNDDNLTYVLIFNKKMLEKYSASIPNPYDTVLDWEWTLDYFNSIIQGISSDSNGDGTMDEKDTYGFVTTWEYGNTFFIGSDLRYIVNDRESDEPSLFLAEQSKMSKALEVLELAQSIYHDNDASYMSPPGYENLGLEVFKGNRGLFYGEVASYLRAINRESETVFGVLPVPKYDKDQEFYRTWTHESGSTLSASSSIKDAETIGAILEAYAILSYQCVKPAYYDITLTTKNIKDAESEKMLDIIFQNRVYDMALYYNTAFGDYYPLFKTAVNDNTDSFSSKYTSVAKNFSRKLSNFMRKLDKLK